MAPFEDQLALAQEALRSGRYQDCEKLCKKILKDEPRADDPTLYFCLGLSLRRQSRFEEAVAAFQQAIALRPELADFHANLADVLLKLGRFREAAQASQKALELDPQLLDAEHFLAIALQGLNHDEEALVCFERVLAQRPDFAAAHSNMGSSLFRLGRLEAALESFRKAVQLAPNFPEAQNNLGNVLVALKRLDEARSSFERSSQLNPQFPEPRFNLGCLSLLRGDFRAGWEGYEWRLRLQGMGRFALDAPRWDGSPFPGKTLLLIAEQGFGDSIQFARYAKLAKQRGGTVLFECQPELESAFKNLSGVDGLIACGKSRPRFDFYCPLLSLPKIFGTMASTIPAESSYLQADPQKVALWKEKVGLEKALKVGIVWDGNPLFNDYRRKSAPLDLFKPLLEQERLNLFSLQKGEAGAEIKKDPWQNRVCDLASEFRDFSDTAAAIQNLDLVLTVDTAVAHLAGALGKPVWTLLMHSPDWRWGLEGEACAWYPSMRLFRQPQPGNWAPVLERVANELGRSAS